MFCNLNGATCAFFLTGRSGDRDEAAFTQAVDEPNGIVTAGWLTVGLQDAQSIS
jgi:hypothetical protein